MQSEIYTSDSRGFANLGWLKAKHSFSFANYYNPERVHFGVLRVLNDDIVEAGQGFGKHPHDNMEIITIPLHGQIEHKDSMGNSSVISSGEIQVMSAGTGVFHSEFNPNSDQNLNLFQIWIFPNVKNVEPRYDQIKLDKLKKVNELYQVLSPNPNDQGTWVYQDAWFYLGDFTEDSTINYKPKLKDNGVYIMIIEGSANIDGKQLNDRDAIAIWDTNSIDINTSANSKILLMDIPMQNNLKQ